MNTSRTDPSRNAALFRCEVAEPDSIDLTRDAEGRVLLRREGDTEPVPVQIRRAFPWRAEFPAHHRRV